MNFEDRKLGVAIHGAGWVAKAHAESWRKNKNARIISVSSRRRESAQRLVNELGLNCAIHDSFENILRDDRVDIVDITGPNHVHAEQGIAAAEAGRHILMEKPMALSTHDNRALRDAVARSGVKSVVSFVERWSPLFANLKSLLSFGTIGELIYVEIDYWHGIGEWYSGWEWVRTIDKGGSAMLVAGCHAVDAMRWFVGQEVIGVSAFSNNKKGLYEYDANIAAIMKFRGGAIGRTSALIDCEMPYSFEVDLVGTDGALRDNRLWSKKLLPGQNDWAEVPTTMPDSGDVNTHPFDAEVNHLVDCIKQDRESHCNIADAYHTHEVCLAIDRSVAEGGAYISLPLE